VWDLALGQLDGVVRLVAARQHAHRCRQLHDAITRPRAATTETRRRTTPRETVVVGKYYLLRGDGGGQEGRRVAGGGEAGVGVDRRLWHDIAVVEIGQLESVGGCGVGPERDQEYRQGAPEPGHTLTDGVLSIRQRVNRSWCGWRRSGRESADRGGTTHTEPIQRVVRRQSSHRVRAMRIAAIQADCCGMRWRRLPLRRSSTVSVVVGRVFVSVSPFDRGICTAENCTPVTTLVVTYRRFICCL
jgi:hypothetical protein